MTTILLSQTWQHVAISTSQLRLRQELQFNFSNIMKGTWQHVVISTSQMRLRQELHYKGRFNWFACEWQTKVLAAYTPLIMLTLIACILQYKHTKFMHCTHNQDWNISDIRHSCIYAYVNASTTAKSMIEKSKLWNLVETFYQIVWRQMDYCLVGADYTSNSGNLRPWKA